MRCTDFKNSLHTTEYITHKKKQKICEPCNIATFSCIKASFHYQTGHLFKKQAKTGFTSLLTSSLSPRQSCKTATVRDHVPQ